MPGGQFTNLKEQAASMGLSNRWPEIARCYAEVNELFGDIVKVTPSSKVVGDMALFLFTRGIRPADVLNLEPGTAFPESVKDMLAGGLGEPMGGWPKKLVEVVLGKSKPAKARAPKVDLAEGRIELTAKLKREASDDDLYSHLMYPDVFVDFSKFEREYGDVSKLPTPAFFYGLKPGEEIAVDIEQGKTLFVKLINVGAPAKDGWLGICIPEQYGGSGLGITEASIMMQTIARSGAGFSGASAVHMNIFGLNPVVVFGTEEQKRRMLPGLIAGKERACFAVTEPNTGLNTTRLKTKAERQGDRYIVSGQKVWISTAQVAEKILLLARTTPIEDCPKPTFGLSLFYTDFDRSRVEVREIEKMGRKAVDSNQVFFDGMSVPAADRIGEEGKGFEYILHGMNPERILIAAEAVGLGQCALNRAANYAKERVVFDRPIGQNQGIQHPLAQNWMALEAANLMVFKAAWLCDQDKACGAESNAAKYLAAEAGFEACTQAVMTHGGFGYAKEYHVERYLRESRSARIAPVSPQLVMSFIAARVLGLPKSY